MYEYTIGYKNAGKEDREAVIIENTENAAINKLKLAVNGCTYAQVEHVKEIAG